MKRVMVRYRVKADQVARNEELVRAVYAELADRNPEGFRYTTVKLDDGVSFVHFAIAEDDSPLPASLPAFAEFQREIRDRCDQPPVVSQVEEVGSFRL
jgi:hypothetical protein